MKLNDGHENRFNGGRKHYMSRIVSARQSGAYLPDSTIGIIIDN